MFISQFNKNIPSDKFFFKQILFILSNGFYTYIQIISLFLFNQLLHRGKTKM